MANIIIVDDSVAIRKQVRQALEGAGHTVTEAENGNDGFQKITTIKKFDLLICDVNMPGMDGIAMIKKVNETIGEKPFPIIMLTTETSEILKQSGKQAGVIGWINKPFKPDLFNAAVKKVLALKAA